MLERTPGLADCDGAGRPPALWHRIERLVVTRPTQRRSRGRPSWWASAEATCTTCRAPPLNWSPKSGRHLRQDQGSRSGRQRGMAAIVAVGVNTEGQREGARPEGVGASEVEPFWTEFLRSLN